MIKFPLAWCEANVPYTHRAMPHFIDGMRKAGALRTKSTMARRFRSLNRMRDEDFAELEDLSGVERVEIPQVEQERSEPPIPLPRSCGPRCLRQPYPPPFHNDTAPRVLRGWSEMRNQSRRPALSLKMTTHQRCVFARARRRLARIFNSGPSGPIRA